MNSAWPEWIVNLGIIATLIGTMFTFFVFYQTSQLSKIYNKKISGDFLTANLKKSYEKFSAKIKLLKKETLATDENDLKHEFWSLITECNGYISICKEDDTDKSIYSHVAKFKSETINLQGTRNVKDHLTYDSIWSYYNSLSVLHEALRNMQSMSAQKV